MKIDCRLLLHYFGPRVFSLYSEALEYAEASGKNSHVIHKCYEGVLFGVSRETIVNADIVPIYVKGTGLQK